MDVAGKVTTYCNTNLGEVPAKNEISFLAKTDGYRLRKKESELKPEMPYCYERLLIALNERRYCKKSDWM